MIEKLNLLHTHLATMSALLNVVAIGIMSVFSATASIDMKAPGSRFPNITNNQITWIASLPSITATFGNFFSGYLSLKLGRKAVLMYVSFPFLLSWLMIAYAPSLSWIYAGRLLSGFCSGLCSVAIPAYIIEIATIEIRGLLGSCYQVSYTIGVLIAMSFGLFFRWSWLAIIGALFVASASCMMLMMPESPAWLIAKGKKEEAIEVTYFLKGKNIDSNKEYSKLLDHVVEQHQNSVSLHDFKEPQLYKPIALAVGLVFFQQFSGVNALMAYTVEIFEHAESSVDPSIAAIIIASVQVIATMIGSVLVDKVGRTTLYIISGIFVSLGLFILGINGIVAENVNLSPEIYGWIPLIGFIIFVASFSLGYGPIPYLMTPEFVPLHSRTAVLAIAGVFSSLFLFIVTKTFNDFRDFLSDYGIYWVYGIFSLLGCLFCWICLPETKGKSINEIQQSFKNLDINPINDTDASNDSIS
uniref:Facilitated trehalose transporter Tret1 n=1 Tax=Parasteatoda tepidariorum TaxID=114398 RepID=A0A2L2YMT9_PARTP